MKNQSIAIIIGLGILVVGAVAYSFSMHTQNNNRLGMHMGTDVPAGMHRMPDGSLMSNTAPSTNMHVMGGMDHSMMMVESEREFLEGMIPHHQEAVDTAREVLARGGSTPAIRTLAEAIIQAQEEEIALMKSWYQDWYGETYVANPADYQPMMRDLSTLSGADLDRVFLEDMIMHHMGAIMMAQSVRPYIEHSEIETLVQAIITSQSAEIQLMRQLINELN